MRVFNNIFFLFAFIIPSITHAEIYDVDSSFGDYEPRPGYAAVVAYPQSRIFVKMQTTANGKTYLLSNSMTKPYNVYLHRLDMDPFFDQSFGVKKGWVAIDSNSNTLKAQDMYLYHQEQEQGEKIYVSGMTTTPDNTNHQIFVGCFNADGLFCPEFNRGKIALYPLGILSDGKVTPMQTQIIVLANTIFVATFYLNDVNQTNVGIYAINKDATVDQNFGNQGWFIIKYHRLLLNLGELIYHNGHLYLVGEAKDAIKNDHDVVIVHMEHDLVQNKLKLFQNNDSDGFGNINKGDDKFIAAQIASDNNLLVATTALNDRLATQLYLHKLDANTLVAANWFIDGKYSKELLNNPVPAMTITEQGSYLFAINQPDKRGLFLMDSHGGSDSSFGTHDGLKLLPSYFKINISGIAAFGKYIYVVGEHGVDIDVQRYLLQDPEPVVPPVPPPPAPEPVAPPLPPQPEPVAPPPPAVNPEEKPVDAKLNGTDQSDPSNPVDETDGFIDAGAVTDDPVKVAETEKKSNDAVTTDESGGGQGKSGCQLVKTSQMNPHPFIFIMGFLLILFVYRIRRACYNLIE